MLAVSRTNRGLVRKNNEDSVLVQIPKLFAIADGMGGHQAGEIASFEAVRILARTDFKNIDEAQILTFMERRIKEINNRLWEMADQDEKLIGMGTTLTVLYLRDEQHACVAHVGDSRIYLLQETGLKQVTSDHSLVAELVRNKKITLEEAAIHPRKNVIMRAVGANPQIEVDLFEFLLVGATKLLLCSDGLTNMVEKSDIERLLKHEKIETAADSLLALALAAGGKDNISFIILDLEG